MWGEAARVTALAVLTLSCAKGHDVQTRTHRYCFPNDEQARWVADCVAAFSGTREGNAHRVLRACRSNASEVVGDCREVRQYRRISTWKPCTEAAEDSDAWWACRRDERE